MTTTTINTRGYIAIPQLAGSHYMGATVFWSSAGYVNGTRLSNAWEQAGLDGGLLPYLPSSEVALGRAVRDAAAKRGYWCEKLPRDAAEYPDAWAIAERKPKNVKDLKAVSFPLYAVVDLSEGGQPVVLASPVTGEEEEAAWKASFLPEINERFRYHLENLSIDDISTWVIGRLLARCQGLRLKPNQGHVYFVHGAHLGQWRQWIDVLKSVSQHVFVEIPTVPVAEALEAVTYAIEETVRSETDRVETALRRHYSGEEPMGKIALTNRVNLSEQVEQQVSAYEELLGTKLDALHTRLGALRASLTAAMVTERGDAPTFSPDGSLGHSVLDDVL